MTKPHKLKKIVVIGASGHAKVLIDIIELEGKYEIVGLIDSFKASNEFVYNYKILGTEKDLASLIKTYNISGAIIGIGDNYTRMKLFNEISSQHKNIKFITTIHPNAIIGKNVEIGLGTVIMAGVIINSDAKIGKNCILNTKSSVGHDSIIGDFSSLAPGAILGGQSQVGLCSAIGMGTCIIENVTIGQHTVVGACSLLNKNIGDLKVCYGIPAKEIRPRKEDSQYLNNSNNL